MKSIGLRLFLAFLCIVVLVVAQGMLALSNASWIMEFQAESRQGNQELTNYQKEFDAARFSVFEILGTYDPDLMDTLNERYTNLMSRLVPDAPKFGVEAELIEEADFTYKKIIKYHYAFADKLAKNLINAQSLDQYKQIEAKLEDRSRSMDIQAENEMEKLRTTSIITSITVTGIALLVAVGWALVLMRTLTDKKNSERALQKSEESLKRAQSLARMGSWHWDYSMQSIHWSEGMFSIHNIPRQEIGPDFMKSIILEEDYPIYAEALGDIGEAEKIDITYRIKWPDGSIRQHRMEGHLNRDESGGAAGIFGVVQDVTKDILAAEKVKQLRNYLQCIVDSMPSILIGVDRNLELTLLNKEAQSLSSISMHKAIGRDLFSVFPFLNVRSAIIRKVISDNLPRKEKKVGMTLFGKKRLADMIVFPLMDHGGEGAVIRIEDVTEMLMLEERMIQTEKMLSIGGLAAGIAHEINNPLAGILQSLQVLNNRFSPDFEKNRKIAEEFGIDLTQLQGYLEKRGLNFMIDSAIESGKRAAQIVNSMLSFSRKSNSIENEHSLSDLMDSIVELARNDYNLKTKYDFRKINIYKNYASQINDVNCDGSQIQQVFLNLLKNGAEAMSSISGDKKREPCFNISIYNDGDMVIVEIADNGPGMPEHIRRRVFEPFFTTKEVGKGTGLGLSVSYFIIAENHEGTMTVESSQSSGTKFIISLPKATSQ